jgi:UDP-glucose 4-epimerase
VVNAVEKYFPEVEIGYTEAEQLNQLSYIVSDEKIRGEGFETAYSLDQGVEELAEKFRSFV